MDADRAQMTADGNSGSGAVRRDHAGSKNEPGGKLSERVIGAAMTVSNVLGPGLSETCYENALRLELLELGLEIEQQQRFPVKYRGRLVGTLIPDLIVAGFDQRLIVDIKVVEAFDDEHVAQMLTYLAVTDLALALLINFRHSRLKWKRVIHTERGRK